MAKPTIPLYSIRLTEEEISTVLDALPMILDREIEEEADPDTRRGPAAEELADRIQRQLKFQKMKGE